jgi:ubiquinone/menaquinone biosynthesis C-methylase UbiE
MTVSASPNAENIAVWNDIIAPKYTRFRGIMVDGLGAHSQIALKHRPARPGDHALDVGCGFGDSCIDLARQVGPEGAVLGIDCCGPFIDIARRDAAAAGVGQVRFEVADAQTASFAAPFDLCFSRFGTMFFQNPAAALRNLRRAVKPDGRLLMLVWRRIEDNDWLGAAKKLVLAHLPPPPEEAPSCGPGPFSMADPDTVREILGAAGWTDVVLERIDARVTIGDSLDEAVAFQLALGPAGEIVRDAGELGVAKRPVIEQELRARLRGHLTDAGVVMDSSSWCVTARAS